MRSAFFLSIVLGLAQTVPSTATRVRPLIERSIIGPSIWRRRPHWRRPSPRFRGRHRATPMGLAAAATTAIWGASIIDSRHVLNSQRVG